MIYILRCDNPRSPSDTGIPTRVRLIGPFESEAAFREWLGYDTEGYPQRSGFTLDDNPCWQQVDLDSTDIPVISPDQL